MKSESQEILLVKIITRINRSQAQKEIFAYHLNNTIKKWEINHRKKNNANRKFLNFLHLTRYRTSLLNTCYIRAKNDSINVNIHFSFYFHSTLKITEISAKVFHECEVVENYTLHISRILTTRRITIACNHRIFKRNRISVIRLTP